MQQVLADASAKLPGIVSGGSYPALLEALIVEALVTLADTKVSVKGVQGQASATQKALTPAINKYKEWATKNKDAAFVSAIDITFDPTPLTSGCAALPATTSPSPSARMPAVPQQCRPHPLPPHPPPLPSPRQRRRCRGHGLWRQDRADEHAAIAPRAGLRDAPARSARHPLRLSDRTYAHRPPDLNQLLLSHPLLGFVPIRLLAWIDLFARGYSAAGRTREPRCRANCVA